MANEMWNGMFLRGNLGETGTVPRSSTSSQSPDLIAYGTAPMGDPTILESEDTYGNGFSNTIFQNQFNYMYMRAKNLHNGPLKGHFEFYYAPSNLLLLPNNWTAMATSQGNKNPPFEVERQNQIAATTDPFTWLVKPPPSGHYCLIGVVVDDLNPSPVKMTERITEWTAMLANNGNIAQRNTNLVMGNVPDLADTVPYNQGSEGSKIDLTFIVKNVPKGSTFKASSGTPLPEHGPIVVEVNDTQMFDFKIAAPDLQIPKDWFTVFGWTLNFGIDWGDIVGVPSVEVRGELVQTEGDPLYNIARVADPLPDGGLRVVGGGPVKIVTFGSFTTVAVDMRNPAQL